MFLMLRQWCMVDGSTNTDTEEVSEHTDLGYKEQKVKSAKERKKRLKEMDEIVKEEIK